MSNLGGVLNQLRAEHKQAQQQVERLEAAMHALEGVVGRNGSQPVLNSSPKRHLSAAARRRIAQAQRARWAKARKQQPQSSADSKGTKTPTKRTMSAAARRKIAAFQRARWAKIKGHQKRAA
jgi:hypothetical protein